MTQHPVLQDSFTIERMIFSDLSTIGEMRFDGEILCHCLELSCRKPNTDGKLAIASGHYEVTLSDVPLSPLEKRFGCPLPLINDVPDREGIRIHVANYPEQLEGCIAPCMRYGVDVGYDSKKAFDLTIEEIRKRLSKGKLFVSIIGGVRPGGAHLLTAA